MIGQGLVGVQNNADSSVLVTQRLGKQADTIVSELHGRYYESCYRKNRFIAAQQAVIATATIAGLATAITGAMVVANPVTSQVNMVMEKFGLGFVLAPAASLAYGLAVGISTTALSGTLTSITPRNAFIGGAAPVGQVYVSASVTLPVAATVSHVLGSASVTVLQNSMNFFDLEGSVILPPGGFMHFWTSAVMAASGHLASISWEEVPA